MYLGWWTDSDEAAERWVFLPLSPSRLYEILSGNVASLEALRSPEDGYLLVVDVDFDTGSALQTTRTNADALPKDSLPLEGARFNAPTEERALARFYEGIECHREGNDAAAIEIYTQAIDLDPDMPDAYNNRGNAFANLGEFDRAMNDYSKALNIDADYTDAYANRAFAYIAQEKYDLAILDCNKAIDLDPENPAAYINRSGAYQGNMDHFLAVQDLDTALKLDPNNPYAYFFRSLARLCLDEPEKAISDMTVANNMGLDIVALFESFYRSVSDFEQKYKVKAPEEVAAMVSDR